MSGSRQRRWAETLLNHRAVREVVANRSHPGGAAGLLRPRDVFFLERRQRVRATGSTSAHNASSPSPTSAGPNVADLFERLRPGNDVSARLFFGGFGIDDQYVDISIITQLDIVINESQVSTARCTSRRSGRSRPGPSRPRGS